MNLMHILSTQMLTISTLTQVPESPEINFVLIAVHSSINSLFSDFHARLPPKSLSPPPLPLENMKKVQRCSELLHRNGLCHHVRRIHLRADLLQDDHLIIADPLP